MQTMQHAYQQDDLSQVTSSVWDVRQSPGGPENRMSLPPLPQKLSTSLFPLHVGSSNGYKRLSWISTFQFLALYVAITQQPFPLPRTTRSMTEANTSTCTITRCRRSTLRAPSSCYTFALIRTLPIYSPRHCHDRLMID